MTVTIRIGDCRALLKAMPEESVNCVVTSPPYFGLRSYLPEGHADKSREIGSEPTPEEHIAVLVDLFRDVRRVLKPEGTLWLNYGDCYATAANGRSAADTKAAGTDDRTFRDKPYSTVGGIFKAKDLMLMPSRLAIALHADGWYIRSEIIWGKTNPMPDSSGAYRPSTAHEKIFMLAKSDDGQIWRARDTGELSFTPDLTERCPLKTKPDKMAARWINIGTYYDALAVRKEMTGSSVSRLAQNVDAQIGSTRANGGRKTNGNMKAVSSGLAVDKQRGPTRRHAGFNDRWDAMSRKEQSENGRLLRNYEPAATVVWDMATMPFREAHFATFPPELAQRCILAGCPKGGTVLDPFFGAGTIGLVAERLGRNSIGFELSAEYAAITELRIRNDFPMFVDLSVVDQKCAAPPSCDKTDTGQLDSFVDSPLRPSQILERA